MALTALLAMVGCLLLTGCDRTNERPSDETANQNTYFPIKIGEKTLHLQLALTPEERRQGLMFRKKLPEDHGMLFVMDRPGTQGFWMKNTGIPLDIGYLNAKGQLREIHKLFPYDETQVPSRNQQILIAIETNQGWYARNEVKPGAQLDMEALKEAVVARGFSATDYAIQD